MPKVCIISLGTGEGVEHGLAFSVRANNPDKIVFLITEQSEETIPKVEAELGFSLNYEILEATDPNDIERCYFDTHQTIRKLLKEGYSPEEIYILNSRRIKALSASW